MGSITGRGKKSRFRHSATALFPYDSSKPRPNFSAEAFSPLSFPFPLPIKKEPKLLFLKAVS